MNTNQTPAANLENLVRFIEKAERDYTQLVNRFTTTADRAMLRHIHLESTRADLYMSAAAVILETVEENGGLETYARSRGIDAETWAPYVRDYGKHPGALARLIDERITVLEHAETAASEYIRWANDVEEELARDDINAEYLANLAKNAYEKHHDLEEALIELEGTTGIAKARNATVTAAHRLMLTGYADLMQELREALETARP